MHTLLVRSLGGGVALVNYLTQPMLICLKPMTIQYLLTGVNASTYKFSGNLRGAVPNILIICFIIVYYKICIIIVYYKICL